MARLAVNLEGLTFPGRDESFAAVVARLSEPTDAPPGDNFVSNEDSYPRVTGEVARRAPKGGVYLGVGPDQNFTLIAAARPPLALIADFRRRNLLVHLLHKALFTLSADRVSYLSRLTARDPGAVPADPGGAELAEAFARVPFDRQKLDRVNEEVVALLRPLGVVRDGEWAELSTIQARIAGPGVNVRFLALTMYPTLARLMATTDREGGPAHLLAAGEHYRFVRTLQETDRLIPVVADLAGETALPALGDWLRGLGLKVGVFYVSDVEFFLLRGGRFDAYVANLGRLPWADGGLVVRSSTREIDHPARVAGDHGTTLVADALDFLAEARAGGIKSPDDLFRVVRGSGQ